MNDGVDSIVELSEIPFSGVDFLLFHKFIYFMVGYDYILFVGDILPVNGESGCWLLVIILQ
jgi:hypothetical protein